MPSVQFIAYRPELSDGFAVGEFAGLKACLAASIAPVMDALGERATPNIAVSALLAVAADFAQDVADEQDFQGGAA